MASINKEWIGITLTATLMAAFLGWACNAAQQKAALDIVHVTAHGCEAVAIALCNAPLLAKCKAGHDITAELQDAVASPSLCMLDGGAE